MANPMFALKVGQHSPTRLKSASGTAADTACLCCCQGPNMIKGTYPPNFPLKHQQKDLRLALRLAEASQQTVPMAAAANEAFKRAAAAGRGDDDMCAVYEALKGR